MKKLFLALCAFSAMSLVACHKDDPQPTPQGGNDNPQQEEIPVGEGIYNPAVHISSIVYNDGTPADIWIWENRKLQSINNSDNCGGYTPVSMFNYDGWRLSQMTMSGDMPAVVNYTYVGNSLNSINISSGGMQMADIQLRHTGDMITHMDIDVNETMLQLLIDMLGEGGFDYGDDVFTSVLGRDLVRSMARSAKAAYGEKLSVQSTQFAADIIWDGYNVSRILLSAQLELGITGEELSQIMSFDSSMAIYATLLNYVAGDQELPLDVTINDTMDYTYDDHANPLKGFLGNLDVAALSSNNVTSSANHGSMNADITITIPILGDQHIPFGQSLGDGQTLVITYTYNTAGYPAMTEDSDGKQTTYSYSEN